MPSNFVAFQLELSRKALAASEINRVRSPPKAGPAEAAPAAALAALSGSPGKALLAARREEEAAVRLQKVLRPPRSDPSEPVGGLAPPQRQIYVLECC